MIIEYMTRLDMYIFLALKKEVSCFPYERTNLDDTDPWGRLPIDRMNCVHIKRTQAKRRITKIYMPTLWPKGSSFGSERDPAMK